MKIDSLNNETLNDYNYKNNYYSHSYSSKAFLSGSISKNDISDSKDTIVLQKNMKGYTSSNLIVNDENNFRNFDIKKLNSFNGKNLYVRNLENKNTIVLSELYNQLNRFDYYQDQSERNVNILRLKTPSRKLYDKNETSKSEQNDITNSFIKYKLSKTKRTVTGKVFWPKEKMENIREKFKTASEKIKKKTEKDFYELNGAIKYGDSEFIL